MLARLLTRLGFTRDDAVWLWGRVVGVAGILTSGVFDINYWLTSVGATFHFSPTELKLITSVSAVILWISGKQDVSRLPGGTT